MNVNYYNEFDKGAAAWLRELISAKLIPFGYVDERSITEVTASDVQGFTQCHFFAGIGGWSYALRQAGVDPSVRLWTGSPPCQPFSTAGKQLGQLDERHLAPTFMRLVAQCRPPVLFGEQVAAAIGKHWLDDLFTELENENYTCGAAVLPACSVGAPHKRDRLFFGAKSLVHTDDKHISSTMYGEGFTDSFGSSETPRQLADDKSNRRANGSQKQGGSDKILREAAEIIGTGDRGFTAGSNPHDGFWSDADWLGCRDGKFRPVEPGTFPLANGVPARMGRLRGYGNAIVPQVAAEFVKAFMSC